MSPITIRTVSIIISGVNDAFCYLSLNFHRFFFSLPQFFIIDNIFLSLSHEEGGRDVEIDRTFFIQRFFYLKWEGIKCCLEAHHWKNTGDESIAILHNIFHSLVLHSLSPFPMNYEKKRKNCFQLCKFEMWTKKISTRLRVYNVFFCLLSFWCFTLEWTLLAFRRYHYEYDASQGWGNRWGVWLIDLLKPNGFYVIVLVCYLVDFSFDFRGKGVDKRKEMMGEGSW